jgi:phospholipid transport system substrate-binding protein
MSTTNVIDKQQWIYQLESKVPMKRAFLRQVLAASMFLLTALVVPAAHAEDEAPDALIKRLSVDVLETIKNDKAIRAGDMAKVIALVDSRIMPNVNFQRMTASAVGPAWRQATPEQQKRLQEEIGRASCRERVYVLV